MEMVQMNLRYHYYNGVKSVKTIGRLNKCAKIFLCILLIPNILCLICPSKNFSTHNIVEKNL